MIVDRIPGSVSSRHCMLVPSGSHSKKPATAPLSGLFSSPSITCALANALFVALLQQSAEHLFSFQSLAHSLCVYPGWRLERPCKFQFSFFSASCPATPLEATLTDEHRVLPCFGRSCPLASPLESTLARFASVTPLGATLTENQGRGALPC